MVHVSRQATGQWQFNGRTQEHHDDSLGEYADDPVQDGDFAPSLILRAIDRLTAALVDVQVLRQRASVGEVEMGELSDRLDRVELALKELDRDLRELRDEDR